MPATAATNSPTVTAAGTVECGRCQHADRHGWFGTTTYTHCRTCHLDWKRHTRQAHCTSCCAHFISPRAFDAHMTANGCVPPDTVHDAKGRPRFTTRTVGDVQVHTLVFYGERPNFDDLT